MKGVVGSPQSWGVPRKALVTKMTPLNVVELVMMTVSDESGDSTRPLRRKRCCLGEFFFSKISLFI